MSGSRHRAEESARRKALAAFLRTHRARLRPADVGLPDDVTPGLRRTSGLRREEVAELSGVGVTWYTWLEQGREITASEQVVDALARALRLDPEEHRHLRHLAGLPVPAPLTPVDGGDVRPRLHRLVEAAAPNIAVVYDVHLDYLVWNTPYVRVRTDPALLPADRRNLLWMMFTDAANRARMPRWEGAARALMSQFRAAFGRRPGDPRFAELVAMLTEASPEFREWWPEYPVHEFRPAMIQVAHPEAGLLDFEVFQLRLVESPDLVMVLHRPATTADLDKVAALLHAGPAH